MSSPPLGSPPPARKTSLLESFRPRSKSDATNRQSYAGGKRPNFLSHLRRADKTVGGLEQQG